MNSRFERNGPVDELSSYPIWAQDMVGESESEKLSVVRHELFAQMSAASLNHDATAAFMGGIWPVIERFPGYMAMNLLKTQFGRSAGDNLARRWLVRNIRVEQNHAEYWLTWADGVGVDRQVVLNGWVPPNAAGLANWCEEAARSDTLAAGIAATNYAVEGATGEWSQLLYDSETYRNSIPADVRTGSLRWLQLHAAYDDTHPWEALEIVCTLLGTSPAKHEVSHITECVKRSYTCMRILADHCVEPRRTIRRAAEVAA